VRSAFLGLVLVLLSLAGFEALGVRLPSRVLEAAHTVAAFGIAAYLVVLALNLVCRSCLR